MTPEKKRQFGGWTKRHWREIRRQVKREWEKELFENLEGYIIIKSAEVDFELVWLNYRNG